MNYKWTIKKIHRASVLGDQQDVVTAVDWRCTASEEGSSRVAIVDGHSDVNFSEHSSFTAYNDLTEEQVLDWVFFSGVNKSSIEDIATKELEESKIPVVIESTPPWTGFYSPLEDIQKEISIQPTE